MKLSCVVLNCVVFKRVVLGRISCVVLRVKCCVVLKLN